MNYSEVSLLIPIRIDTQQRIENLIGVLTYYKKFGFKLIVGEEDSEPQIDYILKYRFPDVAYHFFKSDKPYFYRTKVLNELIREAKTKYVANYDCDVFFPKLQIDKTIDLLNEGYDMVYPYDGRFFNARREHLKNVLNHKFDAPCRGWIMHDSSKGGAIFFNRLSYIKGGGENENFVSWGSEDHERFYRFNTLGYKITRVEGLCYHIDHLRGSNSTESNPYFKQCEDEYKKITSMNKEELEEYVKMSNFIKL